ncbi:MAG: signal peptidase I [bacterium]|nr:signal peptidase I [bacterium]
MKCPRCGIFNPTENQTCFVCGEKFTTSPPAEIKLPSFPRTKSLRRWRNVTFRLKLRTDVLKSAVQYAEMQWQLLRRPWWAAWLSLVPGLGQLYNRQWKKSLVFFTIYFCLILGIIIKIKDPVSNYLIYFTIGLIAIAFVDGLVSCIKKNQDFDLEFQPTRRQKLSALFYALFAYGLLLMFLQFELAAAFKLVHINNNSLAPIIQKLDRICINCVPYWFREPNRGDIVWYYTDQFSVSDSADNLWIIAAGTNIEKVIGLPGETVEIKDRKIYINNQPLLPEYYPIVTQNMPNLKVTLNKNTYFILRSVIPQPGDTVSDHIGFITGMPQAHNARFAPLETWQRVCSVPKEKIIGKLWFIYDPPQRRRFF